MLRSLDTILEGVGAYSNGRDGLRLGGRKLSVEGLDASGNGRHQINLRSSSVAQAALDAGITENVHAREHLPVRRERPHMGDNQ